MSEVDMKKVVLAFDKAYKEAFSEISIEEFNRNDYCIELDDERLTDDICEYEEHENEYFEPTCQEEVERFLKKQEVIPVFKKNYFHIPKGYIKECLEEYMYDNWYCEDPECYMSGYDTIEKFEETFNHVQRGWYIKGEEVGYINLRKDLEELLQERNK